jgi:hypothetical protein
MNTSCAWSSLEGGLALSSPDTLSLTLSEADGLDRFASGLPTDRFAGGMPNAAGVATPDNHLVSRQAVLSRIGLGAGATSSSASGSQHISSR